MFHEYLEALAQKVKSSFKPNQTVVFVLDNLNIHKGTDFEKAILNLFESNPVIILNTPVHSSPLNKIGKLNRLPLAHSFRVWIFYLSIFIFHFIRKRMALDEKAACLNSI